MRAQNSPLFHTSSIGDHTVRCPVAYILMNSLEHPALHFHGVCSVLVLPCSLAVGKMVKRASRPDISAMVQQKSETHHTLTGSMHMHLNVSTGLGMMKHVCTIALCCKKAASGSPLMLPPGGDVPTAQWARDAGGEKHILHIHGPKLDKVKCVLDFIDERVKDPALQWEDSVKKQALEKCGMGHHQSEAMISILQACSHCQSFVYISSACKTIDLPVLLTV